MVNRKSPRLVWARDSGDFVRFHLGAGLIFEMLKARRALTVGNPKLETRNPRFGKELNAERSDANCANRREYGLELARIFHLFPDISAYFRLFPPIGEFPGVDERSQFAGVSRWRV